MPVKTNSGHERDLYGNGRLLLLHFEGHSLGVTKRDPEPPICIFLQHVGALVVSGRVALRLSVGFKGPKLKLYLL